MTNSIIAVVAFFAISVTVAIIVAIWLSIRGRRTRELRSKFGPEYRRVARAEGDAAQAEQILQERAKRVKKLDIRPLTEAQRYEFADAWEHAQAEFVDDRLRRLANADPIEVKH